ncbi:hypothetical protein SALWKB12_1608 [Snodgrassella communis]|nr:hypothetical protein SALWKB12_1608 [Snodgrassella communis]
MIDFLVIVVLLSHPLFNNGSSCAGGIIASTLFSSIALFAVISCIELGI